MATKKKDTLSSNAALGGGHISWFSLSVLTVVAVASLRSDPADAFYGLGSIVYYLVPALLFFVPMALVAAELATGWRGGVYVWVREALGNRWGFGLCVSRSQSGQFRVLHSGSDYCRLLGVDSDYP